MSDSTPSSSYYQCPTSFFALRSYSYKPLERNEIRLIKLEAPIKSLPHRGKIIHVPLSAELGYWALSYCWGRLGEKRTIILDGKKLRITVNLDDALRQLGKSYRLLWADAICLNQEDLKEKDREVGRMGEIYSSASGVAVWLGVASNTSDRAMDFLQELATKRRGSRYDEYLEDPGKFGAEWTALKDLLRNGYWSRTWIIQELALCRRSKIVHCGTKSLPWDNFENVFDDRIFDDFISRTVADLQEPAEVSAGYANIRMLFNWERDPGFGGESLCNLFLLTNRFLATNPLDKIYGILALCEKLREVVPEINYANSKDVVFRDLTKAMLAAGYNLDLTCFKLPTHFNRPHVVSWVPDWDVRGLWMESPEFLMQALWDKHSRSAYSADAGKDAVISYVGDGSILRVRGISYDKVDGLGSSKTHGWLTEDPRSRRSHVVEPDHEQNAYGSDLDTFRALKQLSQETFRSWNPRAPQGELSLNNECLFPKVYRHIASMDPNSSLRTKNTLEWLQRMEEFIFVDRSLQEWYEMACTRHGDAFPVASSSSAIQVDPELDGMLNSLDFVRLDGWKWLSTERGYLGRTHPQTQQGDEIVIVQGCSVPMVLRRRGEHYKVVCAAYVQGIMNGEALQGVSDDQMQDFDLA